MTTRSEDPDRPFFAEPGDGPKISSPPKAVVRIAAVAILALAGLGLARGVLIGRPVGAPGASPLSVLTGASAAAAANAKAPVVLARDDNWSVLSGPQMIDEAQKPKAEVKPAESDDEDDDSASPAAQTAAADAIAPDAPDAAPAAQAASSTAALATSPPPPPPPPPPPQ